IRHFRRLLVRQLEHCVSTFLRPFAPPALPGFHATTDALTPARQSLWTEQVSLFTAHESPVHSISDHPRSFLESNLVFYQDLPHVRPTSCTVDRVPSWVICVTWASPVANKLAKTTGRIEFTLIVRRQSALRTGRSPPVALHLVS